MQQMQDASVEYPAADYRLPIVHLRRWPDLMVDVAVAIGPKLLLCLGGFFQLSDRIVVGKRGYLLV